MKKKDTSWEKVADWYGEHLESTDTYQSKVILPNLARIFSFSGVENVLDLACGDGFFTRAFSSDVKSISGCDLSQSLIEKAKGVSPAISYFVADASTLSFAKNGQFDVVYSVLALQNMEHLSLVLKEVSRVLTPNGRLIFVLNHPTFRIPKKSSWGFDEKEKTQYRRIDAYLTPSRVEIDMHPGAQKKILTYSFHRSLQDYIKALRGANLAVVSLEEWISHKESQKGPRSEAEDRARKEIPLFMCVEARPFHG
jgi:ubiquinone/menaquinone biosynthesis C-methylase UbiE